MVGQASPRRRYLWRLGISMSIYVVSLFVGKMLVKHDAVDGAALWSLALLPGLSVVGAFYAIAMLIIEQKDEFVRMLIVRQVLYATGIALSLTTVWGFLENFGLVNHVEGYWVAILWFFGFAVGGLINRLTLGSWGECW